jgi:hypothetical protein
VKSIGLRIIAGKTRLAEIRPAPRWAPAVPTPVMKLKNWR